jgi:hypothetical protein
MVVRLVILMRVDAGPRGLLRGVADGADDAATGVDERQLWTTTRSLFRVMRSPL